MSDCSNSTSYDAIRIVIDFEGEVDPWQYPLALNGRTVRGASIGGVRYAPERTCTLEETYRGYPCNDYTCSECGKTHCAPRRHEHCPRCGAKVVS